MLLGLCAVLRGIAQIMTGQRMTTNLPFPACRLRTNGAIGRPLIPAFAELLEALVNSPQLIQG
jgi:hypothetical protein